MLRYYTSDRTKKATLPIIWRKAFGEQYNQFSVADKNLLTIHSISYLLRLSKFVDFCRAAKSINIDVKSMRVLRLMLLTNYDTTISLKMWLLRNVALSMQNQPLLLDLKKEGLYSADIALLNNLDNMGLLIPIQQKLKQLPYARIPSNARIQNECQQLLQEISLFITKFVYKKMRFICNSQNIEQVDIIADLQRKATEVFYFLTPFFTNEHRKNTVKRAVHNEGMNIIKYYARPENSRLRMLDNGQWLNIIVTARNHDFESKLDRTISSSHSLMRVPAFEALDTKIALKQFLSNRKGKSKKIVRLLSLREDNKFINFVNSKLNENYASVEDIINNCGHLRYQKLIAQHLNLPHNKIKETVNELKAVFC